MLGNQQAGLQNLWSAAEWLWRVPPRLWYRCLMPDGSCCTRPYASYPDCGLSAAAWPLCQPDWRSSSAAKIAMLLTGTGRRDPRGGLVATSMLLCVCVCKPCHVPKCWPQVML